MGVVLKVFCSTGFGNGRAIRRMVQRKYVFPKLVASHVEDAKASPKIVRQETLLLVFVLPLWGYGSTRFFVQARSSNGIFHAIFGGWKRAQKITWWKSARNDLCVT